jgi:two-component system chemotaxis sensor kinase CheA
MSIDLDDEILQDFLVEAGEIIERLGEELVSLEQQPDDPELLNAIFRGFHTVKGGAGFLALDALVEVSHKTEDVFNLLRQGERQVDAALMDVVLRALDAVNAMFAEVEGGQMPASADPGLLAELAAICDGSSAAGSGSAAAPAPESVEVPGESTRIADAVDSAEAQMPEPHGDDGANITQEEFDNILDALDSGPNSAAKNASDVPADAAGGEAMATAGSDGENITEEEFESLLDELHGQGKFASFARSEPAPIERDELISEEEFEHLLDELHGQGKGPTAKGDAPAKPVAPAKKTPTENTQAAEQPKAEPPAPAQKPAAQKPVAAAAAKADKSAAAEKPPAPAKASAATAAAPANRNTPAHKVETTVRVDTSRLDDIMNLVGELVLARNRLTSLRAKFEDEDIAQAIGNLDLVTSDLQGAVMKTRMQPIKKVFGRFPRVVRDLARNLKKEVNLELRGEETDLDKNLVEALADPLVHLVRNSVDHGIEPPDEREAAGKPRVGTVVLSAEQAGDHILLMITDDGKGMDPDDLRRMAVRKGIMDEEAAARLTEKECFDLIFMPGASTKEEISDVSGRGVGMDVVKTRITQLNGMVEIESKKGEGTTLSIKVPLTLAILPTLMVVLGQRKFALPLSVVNEIFELNSKPTNVVDGQTVIQYRGKAPPLFNLRRWLLPMQEQLQLSAEETSGGQVLMVQVGNRNIGFIVDQVIGQEEVVIKPLGAMLHGLPGLAGATITGDGNVALILDMPGLLKANANLR